MLSGGHGLVENQIKDWIRQHVCAVSKEHGRCKRIVIRHLNVEKKPDAEVHAINIASDPAFEGTEIADKVILEIADAAQRDANDYKAGVQAYGIYAYYTQDPGYAPRKIFRVGAEEEFDPESGPSEPPSEKGLLAQLMRHNEINTKNSLVAMGYIIQTFQKEIDAQRSMNKEFLRQQVDTALLIQDITNDAHKRRIEEKKTELEMSVIEGVFEHLKVVLPIIANKLAGKEVFPARMDRELYVLASFLENLNEQQQTVLRDMLNPQQLALLAELLGMYEDRKSKLTGEPSEAEPDAKGDEKKISNPRKNRLLQLFEKRRTLTSRDTSEDVRDPVMTKIEKRAAGIRDRLKKVSQDMANKDE